MEIQTFSPVCSNSVTYVLSFFSFYFQIIHGKPSNNHHYGLQLHMFLLIFTNVSCFNHKRGSKSH